MRTERLLPRRGQCIHRAQRWRDEDRRPSRSCMPEPQLTLEVLFPQLIRSSWAIRSSIARASAAWSGLSGLDFLLGGTAGSLYAPGMKGLGDICGNV
jgi:hypothetical protein